MRIGELSQRTGISTSRIRFYEKHKVLPQPGRNGNGYRKYPDSAAKILALIDGAQQLGFSLSEIRAALSEAAPNFPSRRALVKALRRAGKQVRINDRRFAERHPNNALANYYLAVSLSKQSTMATAETKADSQQAESLSHEESLLLKAVHIDPNLGAAYLQLGILYTQRTNFARAISAFQKAIEVTSAVNSKGSVVRPDGMTVDEIADVATVAHFRLAQTYLRIGEKDKAQEELQLHTALVQKRKEDTEHKRRKIQEFVISMRNQDSTRH